MPLFFIKANALISSLAERAHLPGYSPTAKICTLAAYEQAQSRCDSVTFEEKQRTALFFYTLTPFHYALCAAKPNRILHPKEAQKPAPKRE